MRKVYNCLISNSKASTNLKAHKRSMFRENEREDLEVVILLEFANAVLTSIHLLPYKWV